MKYIRHFLILALLVLTLFVFAGCGAEVSTNMTIDANFAGKRDITLNISNDDLDSVEGGIAALEQIIKNKIPSVMTYSISDSADGKVILFSLSYTDIKDYRNKVSALISAGITEEEKAEGDVLAPEVIYERNESYFKKGIKFEENFSSVDLIDWFREGIREAGIISESESNWYENANHIVTIEGTEYSDGSSFSVDEQDNTCLSSCEVSTTVLVDNTFERVITFKATDDTIDELAEKGCKLEKYLKDLTPKDAEFETATDDYGNTTYTFSFTAEDSKDLIKKTNKILQTKTNAFSLKTEIDKDRLGIAKIDLTELIDGSFYLEYGNRNPVTSKLYIYNNATVVEATAGEGTVRFNKDAEAVIYNPSSSLEYKFDFDWQIEFETIELDVTPKSGEKIKITMECELSDDLSEEMKKSAIERIESFFDNDEYYKSGDDKITLTFSGKISEVEAQINKLLANASGADPDIVSDSKDYFSVTVGKFNTPSLFSNGSTSHINYDFSPLFGASELKVEEKSGLLGSKYYKGSTYYGEDNELFANESGTLSVYKTAPSLVGIIIGVAFLAAILVGLFMSLKGIKKLKEYIAYKKQAKAAAYTQPVNNEQPESVPQEAYAYSAEAPTTTAEAPAEPQYYEAAPQPEPVVNTVAPASETENEEEEDIL